ncbi:MAG: hypothetical protein OXE59_05370 [Bacteroidetes bacterium]|nr:hypothetical protein [Bacteroidota bacterium]
MANGLSQLPAELMVGTERFKGDGASNGLTLLDYWRWRSSVLLDNTERGILAEFLIASALDLHSTPRREWGDADITLDSGVKIEIKSAAYVQSWSQNVYSNIRFGIAPHTGWDASTGEYSDVKKRWAHIYVFCVYTRKEPPFDPMNVDEWDFYVISTKILDAEIPTQITIGLRPLERLPVHKCRYENLRLIILEMSKEIIVESK